jgi:hypothetical protein
MKTIVSYPIFVNETLDEAEGAAVAMWKISYQNPLFVGGGGDSKRGGLTRPSEYNLYFREQIAMLKVTEPELSHVDRMRRAAENWKEWKRAAKAAAKAAAKTWEKKA